ncbi:hypothetical protein [Burkholderia sp. 22PA0106]|uniref:hypothetical protein n=1 Tax=Burkholderia sp. 22PA0106 TaxID=3237371 RepID=UPI0039C0E676
MQADTTYMAIVAFHPNPGKGCNWKYATEKSKLDADKPLKLEQFAPFLPGSGGISHRCAPMAGFN